MRFYWQWREKDCVGTSNGLNISWGYEPSPVTVLYRRVLRFAFKFNYKRYGFGLIFDKLCV